MRDATFFLTGCLPIRERVPGFATPLFSHRASNGEFVQNLDGEFISRGMLPISVSPGTAVLRDTPIVPCAPETATYFAFVPAEAGIIFGTRDEIAPALRDQFSEQEDSPAIQRSIARFVGDSQLEREANRRLEARIASLEQRPHIQFNTLDVPVSFSDLTVFRVAQDRFFSYWEPDDLGLRAASEARKLLEPDFGRIEIASRWKMEIRRALEFPNPRGRRFLAPGRAGVHFSSSLEGSVWGIVQHSLLYKANSNIETAQPEQYVVTAWRLKGAFADMRDVPQGAEDYRESQELGEALVAKGIGGVLYRSLSNADGFDACVYDPSLILDGAPTHIVRMDLSKPKEVLTIEPIDATGQRLKN